MPYARLSQAQGKALDLARDASPLTVGGTKQLAGTPAAMKIASRVKTRLSLSDVAMLPVLNCMHYVSLHSAFHHRDHELLKQGEGPKRAA
jgi:hypothetical protein